MRWHPAAACMLGYDVEGDPVFALLPCEVAEEDDCVVEVRSNEAGDGGGVLNEGRGTRMARQLMSMKCDSLAL